MFSKMGKVSTIQFKRMSFKYQIALIVIMFYNIVAISATINVEGELPLRVLFDHNADLENGIKANVNSGGYVEIRIYDANLNTLLYQLRTNKSSEIYAGSSVSYQKNVLGQNAKYYPKTWNSNDIKTAAFNSARVGYDGKPAGIYPILEEKSLKIRIQIESSNATFSAIKVPGLGVIDRFGGNAYFERNHFCHDLRNTNHPVTRAWMKMKTVKATNGSDVIIAAHRGVWGDKLGAGNPENSTVAIRATKEYTDILESDIMITADKQLIVSHDYNLKRLSNYDGPSTDYLFRMNASELLNLRLRKRNMDVSEFRYLTFGDLMDELIKNQLVLTIDIKDIIARSKNGVCIDNCEYDPKTHGEEANRKRLQSWMDIFKGCIKVAAEKNALHYIAFKVPHKYSLLNQFVSSDTLEKIQFMPVIQPGRKDYLDFTDSWINEGGKTTIAYETNFKRLDDTYLQPISRHGKTYENFLHYVFEKTGLRPGCYPEEPMGPKGIVNRWAEWLIKDLRVDIRGDYYFLMSVPYGNIMVLTTDRPDMWFHINRMYNQMPKNK